MNIIEHNDHSYPAFQSMGNAAQFALPFAKHMCRGKGYDIGYCKKEWMFPGAIGIDLDNDSDDYHADNLPEGKVDYIFSSHCLEHVPHWVNTLDLWTSKLHEGGTLFLYLPDFSQTYWRPWHNRRHIHCFTPDIIKAYLEDNYSRVFVSGVDLNNSFVAVGSR